MIKTMNKNEKKFYIYHIHGIKIGLTRNLKSRVEKMQGYGPHQYEILEEHTCIDKASDRELELQRDYGYKVDEQLYKNLGKSMNINNTKLTSTFPVSKKKLLNWLKEKNGCRWTTEAGHEFEINPDTWDWINKNSIVSKYNSSNSFIYNEAFNNFIYGNDSESDYSPTISQKTDYSKLEIFDNIREWATVRDLYLKGDPKTQLVKLIEELGELSRAILKDDKDEQIDAIGDAVVVLTNLSHLLGYDIEYCIQSAYDVISKRTGRMVDGTFVKDEDGQKLKSITL